MNTRKEIEDLIDALEHYKWCMKWSNRDINDPQWDEPSVAMIVKCKGEILIEKEKIVKIIETIK